MFFLLLNVFFLCDTCLPGQATESSKPSNFQFDSAIHGSCKAEFYSCKSYIRTWCTDTNKYKLLIGDSTVFKHWAIVRALVPHVKAGMGKEALIETRDKLKAK